MGNNDKKIFYEKYYMLAHIGKGANSHVYKVKHAELGYIRAIKVLNDYIEDKREDVYNSFLKECRTLLAIGNGSHPNIVRIYGPDLIDNHAVVEMDYVQGETLDNYIKREGFVDFNEVKEFIRDVIGAMAYTHHDIYRFLMDPEEDKLERNPEDSSKFLINAQKEKALVKKYGISHNDLHSNNVMRREIDGNFVLLDFGLAVQDGKCVKSSRMGEGNPEYQAPEKIDSENVSPRSDVYSLGVMLYEMLAGHVPFEIRREPDGTISQRAVHTVITQHLTETPPPIEPIRREAFEKKYPEKKYSRDYPQWLDDVIMKCLAKNPDDRYVDAKELLDVINANLKPSEGEDLNNASRVIQYESSENEADEVARIKKRFKLWTIGYAACFALMLAALIITGMCLSNKSRELKWLQEDSGIFASAPDGSSSGNDMATLKAQNDSLICANAALINSNAESVKSLKQEIETLKRKLKNGSASASPAPSQSVKIEYRIPPEVQKELNELRREKRARTVRSID